MILARLRVATHDAHERLEARIDILECASSLPTYKILLQQFYGFYFLLEPRLAEVLARELPTFDFEARRKVPLLARDLGVFGVGLDQLDVLPACRNLPAVKALPGALGCLYVMEGSTLGGKIISRYLRERLDLDATNGAAFFNGYGGETGRMWRAFGEMLTCWAEETGEDDALILQGAIQTFAALEVWLAREEPSNE